MAVNKPLFTDVLQVAVVVEDLDEAVRTYADKYGIGPWMFYEFNPETVQNMILDDKRQDYAMRLATCNIGSVQWELIQPLDDKSLYAKFLKEHGPGLHHVALGTEDYNETLKKLREMGHKIIQGGTWHGFTYSYMSTEDDLNVIVELYDVPKDFKWPEPEKVYPVEK